MSVPVYAKLAGVLATVMLLRAFHESVEPRRHRIDFLGAGLLTGALGLLILAVLEGGQAWAWNSPASIGAFGLGAVLLVGFGFAERRAAEPVLPLWRSDGTSCSAAPWSRSVSARS